MSAAKNKNIVRRYYEEVINTENVDEIEDPISEEYTEVLDGKRHSIGIESDKFT